MTEDVTPPPAPPTTPAWEDFLDIFISPREVFERRKDDPTFFIPLLAVTVIIGLIMFGTKDLMQPIFDAEFARGMAVAQRQNPAITEAQIEAGKGFARTAATFGGFIIIPIAICFVGVLTWLGGKIVGAATNFAQAMMIASLAYVPRVIGAVLGAVQAAVMDPASLNSQFAISVGPARFFQVATTNLALMTVMGRFEIFTLWSTFLIGLGLKVTGKIDTTRAIIGGTAVWVIASLWPVWSAFRAG